MSTTNKAKYKLQKKASRHRRVRARVAGTAEKPRLCVFRSSRHIFAQLIDDRKGVTLASASDLSGAKKSFSSTKEKNVLSAKCAAAFSVGLAIAKKALDLKTEQAVFDRGGYRYHGRVKSLAEGARQGGLKF